MEMSWKALLYDWNGANQALFMAANGGLPDMFEPVAWLGSMLGNYFGAPLVLTALAWRAQRAKHPDASAAITLQMWRFAIACLFAFVLAGALKWGLDFPRPPAVLGAAVHVIGETQLHLSFPSGHSVYAALIVGTLWPLVPGALRSVLLGFLLWVGWSRLAVGAHFPADVLAGWLLGFACVWATRRLVEPAAETAHRRRITASCNDKLQAAASAYRAGKLDLAFGLMEEAHVLGQRYFFPHWRTHAWMLRIGMARHDGREVAGQIGRLFVTPFGHLTGRLPIGNTGGADVSAFVSLPIPDHLQTILNYQANDMQTENPSPHSQTWLASGAGWWTLALLVAGADQAIKYAVHTGLPYGASIPLTGFFNFVHRWNTGAAFSFLADAGGWQRYFFSAVAIIASVVLGWMLTKPRPKIEALGYSLILGGALGNVIDRIHRGYVVDFLDFHWQGWHWPAFNLADIGICVGAALLVICSFSADTKRQPSRS